MGTAVSRCGHEDASSSGPFGLLRRSVAPGHRSQARLGTCPRPPRDTAGLVPVGAPSCSVESPHASGRGVHGGTLCGGLRAGTWTVTPGTRPSSESALAWCPPSALPGRGPALCCLFCTHGGCGRGLHIPYLLVEKSNFQAVSEDSVGLPGQEPRTLLRRAAPRDSEMQGRQRGPPCISTTDIAGLTGNVGAARWRSAGPASPLRPSSGAAWDAGHLAQGPSPGQREQVGHPSLRTRTR